MLRAKRTIEGYIGAQSVKHKIYRTLNALVISCYTGTAFLAVLALSAPFIASTPGDPTVPMGWYAALLALCLSALSLPRIRGINAKVIALGGMGGLYLLLAGEAKTVPSDLSLFTELLKTWAVAVVMVAIPATALWGRTCFRRPAVTP